MKTKITISILVTAIFLFAVNLANAQTWSHGSNEVRTGTPNGGLGGASAANGSLLFYNASSTNTVSFQSDTVTTSYTMTLPKVQGASNNVLTNNGSGKLSWQTAASIGAWSILGNASTVDATNFIGTTDNIPFNVRVNNLRAGRIDPTLFNTFWGYKACFSNTTGSYNTAIGNEALYSNVSTRFNTAIGYQAIYANYTGEFNTATGAYALKSNGGNANSAFGSYSLYLNNSGIYNTSIGMSSLYENTTGQYNAALGNAAGGQNTTGNYNTFVGSVTGTVNTTGSYNTFVGYQSNPGSNNLSNATAIGYIATTTATNMMYLGNANALIYCAAGVWTGSDSRFKSNVTENVKGLAFINKLRPVTYNLNTNALDDFLTQNMPDSLKNSHKMGMDFTTTTSTIHAGFIAQEVEQAAQQTGFASSIVHTPDNNNTHYALNYAEIVVPLVKAVQELSNTVDSLQAKINSLNSLNIQMQNQLDQLTEH